MAATFGGDAIFGRSVVITVLPNPNEVQRTAFPGVGGTFQMTFGSRGRRFLVRGLLFGTDYTALMTARDHFLSYADGVARVLVDTIGYSWPMVVFNGDFRPGRYRTNSAGVFLEYDAVFEGLV